MKIFKNKKVLIGVIACVAIGGIIGTILLTNNNQKKEEKQKDTILLKDDLKFEINSEVNLLSLVSEDSKVKVISEDETIDTSTLGEKELKIKYLDKKQEKDYTFKIFIVDTEKPIIEYQKEITTTEGTEIDLLKDVKATDNSKEELEVKVEGEYDFNIVGTYNLKYVVEDSSKNKTEEEFTLTITEKPKQEEKKNSNNSQTEQNTNNSSNNYQSVKVNTSCEPLELYTFVSKDVWSNDYCNHIREIIYFWYISGTVSVGDEIVDVSWGVSADSGTGMPMVEKAKAYLPPHPTGQQAIDLYKSNPDAHYGETALYTVIP